MQDDGRRDRWEAAEEGSELLREGNVEEAIAELERVVLADPDNEYGYFFLGAAHFQAGSLEKAMTAYVRSLEIAPEYVGAMVGLGQTLRLLGRHEQAIRMGKQILARAKDDPDALYLIGLCQLALGERAAACSHLERFLATGPEVEVAQEVHGLLAILRGDVTEAPDD